MLPALPALHVHEEGQRTDARGRHSRERREGSRVVGDSTFSAALAITGVSPDLAALVRRASVHARPNGHAAVIDAAGMQLVILGLRCLQSVLHNHGSGMARGSLATKGGDDAVPVLPLSAH